MRLDRAVTLIAFRAIGSRTLNRTATRLPVLMYHSISDAREDGRPYYHTSTHPEVFAEHMRVLAQDGFVGVTLSDGLEALRSPSGLQGIRQPVALTFDDGYCDFLTDAVPVLERHGFRATMYLPTAFIGHERREFKGRDCLTWSEISNLHQLGFEFGSHTVTHPRLVSLGWDGIRQELVASKRTIEQQLETEVTAFAYPYAFPQHEREFALQFASLLSVTGYRSAVTTIIGRVSARDDALCLRRLPVNSCDDADLLRAKVLGFYNWMAGPQSIVKQLRR